MSDGGPGGPVRRRLAVVVKGYPRLSETFIAQEILALERAGLDIEIWSLRRPTDGAVHPMHEAIRAKVHYLPEYLYQEPLRVLRGLVAAWSRPGFGRLLRLFLRDLRRDATPNRLRRLGQAAVMARELDGGVPHIHVHYLHTPGSVARYTAILTDRPFSFSAHAKDIWTTPDWEKREKIADSAWGVTCTRFGTEALDALAPPENPGRVTLLYHGLDLDRFPPPPERKAGGRVELVTVGRAVAKKGFDDLLDALAALPPGLDWHLTHIGTGELRQALRAQAERLGLSGRITWRGALPQTDVIAALRRADIFVLPCKEGDKGDRDGLPNVIMEAATQALPIVSTRFAGVPEFVREDVEGLLVPPADPPALAAALEALIGDPERRLRLGAAALARVRTAFSFQAGIDALLARFAAIEARTP